MKKLQLTAWERIMLSQVLPQGATLQNVATYLRILELLRLKEDERKAAGWQEDKGTVTIQNIVIEAAITFEDADFAVLRECALAWDRWPVAPQTMVLKERLDAAAAV